MLYTIKSLTGHQIHANDGNIGELKEIYFDDETWAVRYFIVETGSWLSGRKVLLSPQAVLKIDSASKIVSVNLSKEQIKSSPDIDTDQPVSRRLELDLFQYYSWENYAGAGFYGASPVGLLNLPPLAGDAKDLKATDTSNDSNFDPHLRTTERVSDYHIHATDGDIGHVKDFIMDDQSWTIKNLIIDTHNWIGGKKVLLPVRHVKNIDWESSKVITDVSTAFIKDCAPFDVSDLDWRVATVSC